MLGIYVYPVFTACVEVGLLSVDRDKMVRYDEVMDFTSKYMLTNEIGSAAADHGSRSVNGCR